MNLRDLTKACPFRNHEIAREAGISYSKAVYAINTGGGPYADKVKNACFRLMSVHDDVQEGFLSMMKNRKCSLENIARESGYSKSSICNWLNQVHPITATKYQVIKDTIAILEAA